MKFLKFSILFFYVIFLMEVNGIDVAFYKVGTYVGQDAQGRTYLKEYFLPRYYRTTHKFAHSLCKAYGMEFARFENKDEFGYVSKMVKLNENKFVGTSHLSWVLVDGITLTPAATNNWYWTVTSKIVPFTMQFLDGQPDFMGGNEYCLSLGPDPNDVNLPYKFNDYPCSWKWDTTFMCQKMKIIDMNDQCCKSC